MKDIIIRNSERVPIIQWRNIRPLDEMGVTSDMYISIGMFQVKKPNCFIFFDELLCLSKECRLMDERKIQCIHFSPLEESFSISIKRIEDKVVLEGEYTDPWEVDTTLNFVSDVEASVLSSLLKQFET